MANPIIKINQLSKIYRVYKNPGDRLKETLSLTKKKFSSDFHALNNISLVINKGETIGIIGRNGSGKSTLLKILSHVSTPTTGSVQIQGSVSAILELGAGFNQEYNGLENIYLNGTIQGKSKEQMNEKLNDILTFADIGDFIYQPVKTYSSGMFARLAFAVAINVEPDILIVDEALAVGDMKFQAKCFRKFEELKAKGTTILFVGHDVSSIRKFCDKAMWLHQGNLVAFGDTLGVTAEYMEFMNSEESGQPDIKTLEDNGLRDGEPVEMIGDTKIDAINRWGTHKNSIKSVALINEKGRTTTVFQHGEIVRIILKFSFPEDIDLLHFSAAISIKNTMGLDLIVFTTHDDKKTIFSSTSNEIELTFEFVNYLTEGDYILVAALENRKGIQPEYYDFIEGAAYFKSITTKQLFGVIHTPYRILLNKEVNLTSGR
ncbi:ABC transporter ATP-binding protein [Paenibacillus riograndensis]|uniref:ABC transporter n=1 Tax=Paenibacillus riograndensis SBR5 TaxID=1073571 RepID=A0A0E4HDU3_9BACL|nr:ABC transporter ATP-binding protein [Paenibacillus riograndensis]CQR58547.1 ABC transporter [Paenibacillus riograndensis SBR5]